MKWFVFTLMIAGGVVFNLDAQEKSGIGRPGADRPTASQTVQEADLQRQIDELRRQNARDHDLLFKLRQHVLLTPAQMTSYTESAWTYGK